MQMISNEKKKGSRNCIMLNYMSLQSMLEIFLRVLNLLFLRLPSFLVLTAIHKTNCILPFGRYSIFLHFNLFLSCVQSNKI